MVRNKACTSNFCFNYAFNKPFEVPLYTTDVICQRTSKTGIKLKDKLIFEHEIFEIYV